MKWIDWTMRLFAAGILLWTLTFKFTAAPESVALFTQLGVEPWGRIGTGVIELVVALLLLVPRTVWLGALGGMAVMSGAILSHIVVLGINVLFGLAIAVFIACAVSLWVHRHELPLSHQGA